MKTISILIFAVFTSFSAFAMNEISQNTQGFINSFALSPDGNTVAYANGSQVFLMSTDGQNKREITGISIKAYMGITRMFFSPDSKHLAFDIPSANTNNIVRDNFWMADLQTLKATPVESDIQNLMDISAYIFTADSKYFIYPRHNGINWVMMRYNLATAEKNQLVDLVFNNDFFFVESIEVPSAKVILLGLPQTPFNEVGFVNFSLLNWETGENTKLKLPYVSNRVLNILGVSPDASRLFYVQCEGQTQNFYTYDRSSNTSTLLQTAPGCMLDWSEQMTQPMDPQVVFTQSYLFFNNYSNHGGTNGFYALNVNTHQILKISDLNAEEVQVSKDQTHVFYNLSPADDLTGFHFDLYYYSLTGQKATRYSTPNDLPLTASLGYLMNPQQSAVFLVRGGVGGPSSSPFIKADFWKLSVNGPDTLLGQIDGHLAPNRDATRACAMAPQGNFVICNTVDRMNVGHLYRFEF